MQFFLTPTVALLVILERSTHWPGADCSL